MSGGAYRRVRAGAGSVRDALRGDGHEGGRDGDGGGGGAARREWCGGFIGWAESRNGLLHCWSRVRSNTQGGVFASLLNSR